MKNKEFIGKNILITGSSKGLGKMCATAFEKNGANIIACGRNNNDIKKIIDSFEKPKNHRAFIGDLTKFTKINQLNDVIEEFGTLDIILHIMGGGLGKHDPLLDHVDFELLLKTNLSIGVELNRLLIPSMIKRGQGNVLHVGSTASTQAIASVGYNTVKAAVAAYVRSLGRELASTGVIVTGILPGAHFAPENSWERLVTVNPDIVKKFIEDKEPRNKLGSYKEIIPMIEFLSSDRATMMTGCCVPIDGGESLTYDH